MNYERLEFLGDSIIGSVVSEWLFKKYPDKNQGYLSKKKSLLVSRNNLSLVGKKLKLIDYAYIDKSVDLSFETTNNRIISDLYESIVAAIFLDSNYKNVKIFIKKTLLDNNSIEDKKDYKSQLNEFCYKDKIALPIYTVLDKKGPDHIKTYKVKVSVNNKLFFGTGMRIKDAEINAAKKACLNIL